MATKTKHYWRSFDMGRMICIRCWGFWEGMIDLSHGVGYCEDYQGERLRDRIVELLQRRYQAKKDEDYEALKKFVGRRPLP